MKRNLIVTLAFALLGTSSQAAVLCPPFSSFQKPVKRCEDNFVLGHQALTCVEKYYSHVEKGKAKIDAQLKQQVEKMKKMQSDSYDRADAGYQKTQAELKQLIADGDLAKLAVDSYLPELFMPEDYDQPQHTGMTTEFYLSTEPCYATPKSAITDAQEMIAQIIADLKAVDLTAGVKKDGSQDRSQNTHDLTKGAVSNTHAPAPKPIPAGNSAKSASDLTGTQKAKEDAAKAKALIQQGPKK